MHKITFRYVNNNNHELTGFIGCIEPPINVSDEAVTRYIRHGNLEGAPSEDNESLVNPMLLGSNAQTRMYVELSPGYGIEEGEELFGERITELLGHLGIESQIEPKS
jgi:hypothetical protein